MDVNGIGAESYYFNKLCIYWADKCSDGLISEDKMEHKIDIYSSMSTRQMKNAWEQIKTAR